MWACMYLNVLRCTYICVECFKFSLIAAYFWLSTGQKKKVGFSDGAPSVVHFEDANHDSNMPQGLYTKQFWATMDVSGI